MMLCDSSDARLKKRALEPDVLDEEVVEADGSTWRVVLRLQEHAHHLGIERDGELVIEHVGALSEDWPALALPPDVRLAVITLVQRLSGG